MIFLKKHYFLIGVILSCITLSGCEKQQQIQQPESNASSPKQVKSVEPVLNATIQNIPIQLPECSGRDCPKFIVKQLKSNQKFIDLILEKASLKILQQNIALSLIQQGEMQASSDVVLKDATFDEQIQQYANEFSHAVIELKKFSANTAMSFHIEPQILKDKKNLVTIKLSSYSYLGGAHGASTQQYFVFDLNEKRQVELDDVIKPDQKKAFHQLAYEQFSTWVKAEKLADHVDQYEQSWEFKTTQNFYFSPKGLVLQYEEYEIGPYAVGMPTLTIPYDTLKTVIQPEFLP